MPVNFTVRGKDLSQLEQEGKKIAESFIGDAEVQDWDLDFDVRPEVEAMGATIPSLWVADVTLTITR